MSANPPPHAVLSDQLEKKLRGRRLRAAVFLTFRFDPEFFEQEVLPIFFDVPLSHAAAIKLVQMEDALRSVPDGIAVYYDQNGLVPEAGPARLDVKRIAVRHRTGIFHPKNIFALVEDMEPDEEGDCAQTLLVASLSANLTEAGWWRNVEACHIEEINEGDFTRLREDLINFLDGLERRVGDKSSDDHASLRAIRGFLRTTNQRKRRSTGGSLHTHFFDGRMYFLEFLRQVTGYRLDEMYLEIISPYFDKGAESGPLKELIKEFAPREVRVFLPRADTGEVLCSPEMFESVRNISNVTWARLPADLLKGGKGEDVRPRTVHAKVYRFFSPQSKREILFVGSVNLTEAAHRLGGNLETGFLIELSPQRRPDWWLVADTTRPRTYKPQLEDEGNTVSGGTKLSVRFWWNTTNAEVYWDDSQPSPKLSISSHGVEIVEVNNLPSRKWSPLPSNVYEELKRVLRSTSLLTVSGEGKEPGLLLVQEEGMSHRPSLLFDLPPSEILRYWSLLTLAQRAAFLEARAPESALTGEDALLVSRFTPIANDVTFFDRFAGIFLAFANLERAIRSALHEGRDNEAVYRLFGQKYDSLGSLLLRVLKDNAESKDNLVDNYVIGLCARQMVRELRRENDEFWQAHTSDITQIQEQINALSLLRDRLIDNNPLEMSVFLDWFDHWFIQRAKPIEMEER